MPGPLALLGGANVGKAVSVGAGAGASRSAHPAVNNIKPASSSTTDLAFDSCLFIIAPFDQLPHPLSRKLRMVARPRPGGRHSAVVTVLAQQTRQVRLQCF